MGRDWTGVGGMKSRVEVASLRVPVLEMEWTDTVQFSSWTM